MAEGDETPGTPEAPEPPEAPPPPPLARVIVSKDLAWMRRRAQVAIDAKAEEVRGRFATPGKHTIYDRKLREAERYLAALGGGGPGPNLNAFPYLRREAGLTAPDAEAVARLWVAMAQAWEAVSPEIEVISLTAKDAVRAAGSRAAVDAATGAAIAALDALGEPPPRPPRKDPRPFPPPPATTE